jgi:hypothetical protein
MSKSIKNMKTELAKYISTEVKKHIKSLKEAEDDINLKDDNITANKAIKSVAPTDKEFEENPLEYIISKYPSLKDTLEKLLTKDFRDYITGIYIIAPKPTKFKIVLHNNRPFYLTYMGRTYEVTIQGKRYYLIGLGDIQRATMAISDLLSIGVPKGDLSGPDEMLSPSSDHKEKENKKPPEENDKEEKIPGEDEEIDLKESYMKKQTNEAIKTASINVGDKFTVTGDMGKFKKGDKVEVTKIKPYGADIRIHMISDTAEDFIIVDKDDDSIDLEPSINEDIYGVAGNPDEESSMKAASIGKMDARLKNAIKAYKKYYERYQQTPRSDSGKALAAKRMVDLAAAVKKEYGVDLEKMNTLHETTEKKTWAEGYKEGYLEGYKDAIDKKLNKFKGK